MPVFGERGLQASSRPCVSLTAVGGAEIVNRMSPGACGPSVEWSKGEFDLFHPVCHLAGL